MKYQNIPWYHQCPGQFFERRLIEKYITENGSDPINGKELTLEMLIDIKTTPVVKPKPPSATSIPAILKTTSR
uniref:Pre-mRNA-processing factor 19 n=1 Tax=Triatoma infestans TaxID=30076 RepID=A0A170VPV1_TRIIF